MFDIRETGIPGCLEIQPMVREDPRGRFVKIFHGPEFQKLGLETEFREEYYTTSRQNVIRGMHFQVPPFDHVKLVYCPEGSVFDVAVDIRKNSPHFGRFISIELSREKGNAIYIPKGFAHGFFVTSASATLVYKVSTVHSPDHDQGILWNSIDIPWPTERPSISDRDCSLPRLVDFDSPFLYG
ncbi:MAG: dTDP-4-dehydrorhamnose 3,5-epimerase [Sterolibacterium sp.]|jgi:dTDP-4-dehydrorhamnose 3,5-epimerase